jgi:hypothetical protein
MKVDHDRFSGQFPDVVTGYCLCAWVHFR